MIDLTAHFMQAWRHQADGLYARGVPARAPYEVTRDPRAPDPASRAYWRAYGYERASVVFGASGRPSRDHLAAPRYELPPGYVDAVGLDCDLIKVQPRVIGRS